MIGTRLDRLVERRTQIQTEITKIEAAIAVENARDRTCYLDANQRKLTSPPHITCDLPRAIGARIHALNKEREALGKASAALGRLIRRAERPVVVLNSRKPPEIWSPKPSELAGPTRKPRLQKEQKPTGKMKASQRQQMRRS